MTMITLINPWSNAVVYKDVADLVNNFDSYLSMISDETIETINDKVDSDDKADWLTAWAAHVGPDAAGLVILGS